MWLVTVSQNSLSSRNQVLIVETANPLYLSAYIIRLLYKVANKES